MGSKKKRNNRQEKKADVKKASRDRILLFVLGITAIMLSFALWKWYDIKKDELIMYISYLPAMLASIVIIVKLLISLVHD